MTTDDPARLADLGTGQFLQIRKWVESNDIALLTVVFDECKVAIDHYATTSTTLERTRAGASAGFT